jgi:hypothetical protein
VAAAGQTSSWGSQPALLSRKPSLRSLGYSQWDTKTEPQPGRFLLSQECEKSIAQMSSSPHLHGQVSEPLYKEKGREPSMHPILPPLPFSDIA